MKALFDRMFRAMKLDRQLFEEVVADPSIQGQSVWAVMLFAMATAFGTFATISGTAVNIGLITTIIGWYVWAFSVFYISSRSLKTNSERADRKTIMRVMAFASAPGLIRLLGVVPKAPIIVLIVSSLWILIAATIGLKKVFPETSTTKISVITVAAWIAATLFQIILIITLIHVFGVSQS